MSVTIDTADGPVTLHEMWDDFKKGIDISRGPYIEQSYLCPWENTDAVINALMGSTTTSGNATVHVPGFACPQSKNLCCMDAYVIGEGEYDNKDGGPVRFNLPKLRVVYGIRSWEQMATDDPQGMQSFPGQDGPATYAIHSMDFGVEAYKLPTSAYKFAGTPNLPCDVPVLKQVGICKLNVELKKVPFLPTYTIMNLIGKLNDATFFGAPRGMVQFMGARTSKEFESDGTRVQNVSYSFRFRKASWNLYLRPDTAKWDFIRTSDGKYVYEYADLRPLILLQGYAQMVAQGYTDTYGQEAFV